jgi:pyruvate dehydrogenase E1 component alpha subunit
MPSVAVDGVNVLAVYDATVAAIERARVGDGPTFIEAPVYRLRAHGGAGDDSHTGYRHLAEREHWEAFDPLALYEHFLKRKQLLDDQVIGEMETRLTQEIADAFEFALSSPNPSEEDLFRHVYAE